MFDYKDVLYLTKCITASLGRAELVAVPVCGHSLSTHFSSIYSSYIRFLLTIFNTLNAELNPICYLLALLGAYHFLHVSRIRVKLLTLRLLTSYIYIYIYVEHLFLMFKNVYS